MSTVSVLVAGGVSLVLLAGGAVFVALALAALSPVFVALERRLPTAAIGGTSGPIARSRAAG